RWRCRKPSPLATGKVSMSRRRPAYSIQPYNGWPTRAARRAASALPRSAASIALATRCSDASAAGCCARTSPKGRPPRESRSNAIEGRESRRVFIRRDYNGDGVNAGSVQRGRAQGLLRHVELDRQRQVVGGGGRQRAHLLQLQRTADQDV